MMHASSAPLIRPQGRTLALDVLDRLRTDLLDGSLRPNERLRFERLRWSYNASIGTLREALVQLTAEGLVHMEGQRGFRVASVSAEDLQDITDMRLRLEPTALRAAVEQGDQAWEARIVTAMHLLRRVDEGTNGPAREGVLEEELYFSLMSACGSPWLLHFCGVLYRQGRRYRALARPFRRNDGRQAIFDVAEAALARDAEHAATVLAEQVQRSADEIAAVLDRVEAAPPVRASSS